MTQKQRLVGLALAMALLTSLETDARADSVAQIATSVRISRATATLIDPQGRPGMTTAGSRTAVRPGDILTFIAHFTPVPNGRIRGLGGYVTFYVPWNTEVVGARIIDSTGATVAPHRGGLSADGCGPRGCTGYGNDTLGAALEEGSMSQLYADTGIFYATDPRTARVPDGSVAAETFLSLSNGILMVPESTAFGQLDGIVGAIDLYAHNQWDAIQVYAFGVNSGAINSNGDGNTPHRYGSAVAGPETWYPYEASYVGDLAMPIVLGDVVASRTEGPWRRIQTFGAETGAFGQMPPMPDPGGSTRVGVPAVDGTGRWLGHALSADAPLAAYDAAAPTTPYTRAVRFAVGELVVGQEYSSELSVRVLDTPLDPVSGTDTICAEVFGGDGSAGDVDGTRNGKDNTWRYFLPVPACVSLDLLFDLDVNAIVALPGDALQYTITGKNLATTAHTGTTVSYCYERGEVTLVGSTPAGTPTDSATAGCPDPANQDALTWDLATLDPGEDFSITLDFTAVGGGAGNSTIGYGVFTSNELPAPGFQTRAFTVIESLGVPELGLTATPSHIATPAGTPVTYSLTIDNGGTGALRPIFADVTIPAPFTYSAGTAMAGITAPLGGVGDPTALGGALRFDLGSVADIPPGGTMTLTFDAIVPAGTPDGIYPATVETWLDDRGWGDTISDSISNVAEVVIGAPRSDTPIIDSPILAGSTEVCGTTTEADGTTIRVLVAGIEVATTTSAAGTWCATVPTLYGGQRVSAVAEAASERESLPSVVVTVSAFSGVTACSDGLDNDGDGAIDFPDDPDCVSPTDVDEAHTPLCADGVDNDGDGAIDFGADPGCASLLDDDESGPAQCSDGMDNDGDGATDFPDDPGCTSADDVSEVDVPACADGLDNDGDGLTDYPLDPDCISAVDGDEATRMMTPDAGAMPDAGATMDGGVTPVDAGSGPPFDPGGVDAPDGGCGCQTPGRRETGGRGPLSLTLLGLWFLVLGRRRSSLLRD